MKYAYYPGCSLESSAKEYDMSIRAVFNHLGIELVEIEDWHCCGATSAHMTDELLSVALPVYNILWAQKNGLDIIAPCAACFSVSKTADWRIKNENDIREKIENLFGDKYTGKVKINHSLEVLVQDYGIEKLKELRKVEFKEMRVTPYYGCLLIRPPEIKNFDDPEDPKMLEELITVMGGKPIRTRYRTVCCGGSTAITTPDIAQKLSYEILNNAKEQGAECIVVTCPLCQSNLDLNQGDIESKYGVTLNLPVLYFSQLLGVSLGLDPGELGLDKNVVEPWELLSRFIDVNVREYR